MKINLNIGQIINTKYNNYNQRNRYELIDRNMIQPLQSYQPSTAKNKNCQLLSKNEKECFDINSIVKNSVEKINTLLSNNEIKTKNKKYIHHKYSNSIDNNNDRIFEKLNEEEGSKIIFVNKEAKKTPNTYINNIENEAIKTIDRSNTNNKFKQNQILNAQISKNLNKNENALCQSLNDILFEADNDETLLNLESNKLYKNKNEKVKKTVNKTIIATPLKKPNKIKEVLDMNKTSKKPYENITNTNKKSSQIKTKKKTLYEKYIRDDNNNNKTKNYNGSLPKELNLEKKEKYMNTFLGISNNNYLKKKIIYDKETLPINVKLNKGINYNKKSISNKKRNQYNINSIIKCASIEDYSSSNRKKLFQEENPKNNFKLKESKKKIKVLDYLKMNFFLTEYLINNNLFEDLNDNKNIINEFSSFIANKIKSEYRMKKNEESPIKKIQRVWRHKRIKSYTKNENEELKKMVYNNFLMKSGYKIRRLLEIFHSLITNFKECHNNCDDIDKIFLKLQKIINRNLTADEKNLLYKEYINSVIYCK